MNSPTKWSRRVFVGFLFTIESVLLYKLYMMNEVDGGLLASITVIAILPLLGMRAMDISEFTFGKEGIQAKLNEVNKQVTQAKQQIDRLFAHTMAPSVYLLLKKIADCSYGEAIIESELRDDLKYLENIGYIGISGELPNSCDNLCKICKVTHAGQSFIELRDRIETSL